MNKQNWLAWKEAITDTALGTVINFPLNLLVLYVAFEMKMTVFKTAAMTWVVFTVVAIVRKYLVRKHFIKKVENGG